MILRLMGALFAPKYPRHYTGRHRHRAVRAANDQIARGVAVSEATT